MNANDALEIVEKAHSEYVHDHPDASNYEIAEALERIVGTEVWSHLSLDAIKQRRDYFGTLAQVAEVKALFYEAISGRVGPDQRLSDCLTDEDLGVIFYEVTDGLGYPRRTADEIKAMVLASP